MSTIDPGAHKRKLMPPPNPLEEILDEGSVVKSSDSVDLELATVGVDKVYEKKDDKAQISLAKRVLMDCQFTLQKLMFVILSDEDSILVPDYSSGKMPISPSSLRQLVPRMASEPGVPLLVFGLFDVDLHLLSRTFDKDITFYLHAMLMEDCIQRAHDKYKFIIQSHNPRDVDFRLPDIPMPVIQTGAKTGAGHNEHLIEIGVRLIGARSPFYEKIDKAISLKSHTLHINFNRETIAYLMCVGQAFAASQPKPDPAVERAAKMTLAAQERSRAGSIVGSITGSLTNTNRPRSGSGRSVASQKSAKSSTSNKSTTAAKIKKPADDTVTTLKLSLAVAGMSLAMNEVIEGSSLLTCLLANVNTDVEMRARVLMCSGSIGLVCFGAIF